MSEWNTQELGTLLKDKGYIRGPFGSALKRGEMVEEGIPVYEQKNAIYDEREFRFFITPEKFQEMKRFQVKTNDLIISCSGTVGKISIIKEKDPKGIISQALLILRPDVERITLNFLFYFLTSDHGFNLITQVSHGSVQINIAARKIVETIPVPTPPIEEQRAIAEILSSLDDKIDLLHRQNQTLEQMAETLFRQWFVEEADEGWEVKPLSNYFQLHGGFAFKSKDYLDIGKYKVITIKGVQDGYLDSKSAARLEILPEKLKPHQILQVGDILMSLTGNVGRVCLVDEEDCLLNQRVAKIEPIRLQYKAFAYFYFRQKDMIERLTYLSKGSAQLNLSPVETLNETDAFGEDSLINKYCDFANPLLEKIIKNKTQIRTLTALRDTLLPKLMSGEVRVEMDAKAKMEEV